MDEAMNQRAMDVNYGQFGGLAGFPVAKSGGVLHFTRTDGVAQVTIQRQLSAEGAELIDKALRELLVGEDDRLRAQYERQKVEACAAQQAYAVQNMATGMLRAGAAKAPQ